MPTKPTPAVRPEWNTGAANQVTPAGGKIVLGWESEEAPSSAYFNWWMFETGVITDWVLDGSIAPDVDAHIVETDATGEAHLAQLEVVTPNTVIYGIRVDATLGVGIPAITCQGGTGANGHGAVCRGGSGASYGCYGVGGVGGTGVRGEGEGAGEGGSFVGGATGNGLDATGGATAGAGVVAVGTSTRGGVEATGGATAGPGVLGTPGSAAGFGIDGRSHASASSTGAAVRGLATADGTGVHGQAADGHGVVAVSDTSSPTRSALRVAPQDADPTTRANGDIWQNSTTDELSVQQASAVRRLVWRTNGQCDAYAAAAGPTSDNAATFTNACSVSLGAPNAPPRAGVVRIRVTGEVGRDAGGSIDIRVRDTTSSATAGSRNVALYQTGTYERDIAWTFTYTLPAAGARDFEVQIASNASGGANVSIRNVTITIEGVY